MPKLRPIFVLTSGALFAISLSACSDPKRPEKGENKSEKLELSGTTWYDYGNGLINLAHITMITSQASLSGEVMPREYYDNEKNFYAYYAKLNDEQKAVVDAHANFCFDQLRIENLNQRYQYTWPAFSMSASLGAFESGEEGENLSKLFSDLKGYITTEFAETCVIRINGSASLNFDGFSVNLEPFKKALVFDRNSDGQFIKQEIDKKFDEEVGVLKDGKTPWNGAYSSLIKK